MNKLVLAVCGILIAGLAALAVFQHRSLVSQRERSETLKEQLGQATAGVAVLSNELAQTAAQLARQPLPDDHSRELLRLRAEVAMLRTLTNRVEASEIQNPNVGDIHIVSARFGSGTNIVDVTPRVVELLHREIGSFKTTADWMKIDPTPGKMKSLVIFYNYAGNQYIYTATGGEKVSYKLLLANASK